MLVSQPRAYQAGAVSSIYIWSEIFMSSNEAKHGGQWMPELYASLNPAIPPYAVFHVYVLPPLFTMCHAKTAQRD